MADNFASGGAFGRPPLEFRGGGLECLWINVWTWGLTLLTLGIYHPWAHCARQRWEASRTYVEGRPLRFTGGGLEYFLFILFTGLLTAVTLGIFAPWAWCLAKRWHLSHLFFGETPAAAVGSAPPPATMVRHGDKPRPIEPN